jgi:Tfp pilus assembly protein PilF
MFATVWLIISIAASGAPAQTAAWEWRPFRLYVRDSTSLLPLANARVNVGDTWSDLLDRDGSVLIDPRPGVRFPLVVSVTAPGYGTQQYVLDSPKPSNTELHMMRLGPDRPPAMTRVSAAELAPGVRERAREQHARGLEALARRDYAAAEKLFRDAIELTPSSSSAHNNLGLVYLRQGDLVRAAPEFEKAYALAPGNAVAAGNLGTLRFLESRRDESFRLLEQARAGGFPSQLADYLFGLLALERNRPHEAAAALLAVAAERYPYRDLFLAVALERSGRQREAARHLRQFRKRVPVVLALAQLVDR